MIHNVTWFRNTRDKKTKVISHSSDRDHSSDGKKPDGFKHSNSTEVHRVVPHISSRPSLTHFIKQSFYQHKKNQPLKYLSTLWENKGLKSVDKTKLHLIY